MWRNTTGLGGVLNQFAYKEAREVRFAAVDSNCKCITGRALKCKVLGYKFGYKRQFALITASYAKLQVGMGLGDP
jgi:hypothetical protein